MERGSPSEPEVSNVKEFRRYNIPRFQFPSHELAFKVRELVYECLIKFDHNQDLEFQEDEIRKFLVTILDENESEVQCFLKNLFRCDTNNDGKIDYDEMVNFCVEQHFGEIALQRLHRQSVYQRGGEYLMNIVEFRCTFDYALSFVKFNPQEQDIRALFKILDVDRDGYISYSDYFIFLKEYFGNKSLASHHVNQKSVIKEIKNQNPEDNLLAKYSYTVNFKIKEEEEEEDEEEEKEKKEVVIRDNFQIKIFNENKEVRRETFSIDEGKDNREEVNKERVKLSTKLLTPRNKSSSRRQQIKTPPHPTTSPKQLKQICILTKEETVVVNEIEQLMISQLKVMLEDLNLSQDCQLSKEDILALMVEPLQRKEGSTSSMKLFSQATVLAIRIHIKKVFSDWKASTF